MSRPTNKADLIQAAEKNYHDLNTLIASMSESEIMIPFDFDDKLKYKEDHWSRDKSLRDVIAHLYEWQLLLLNWINKNTNGASVPFLPAPYNWKTYSEMNREIWKKHQSVDLKAELDSLQKSHDQVIELLKSFSDQELFEKKRFAWVGTSNLGSYFISVTASHYTWALKKLKEQLKKIRI